MTGEEKAAFLALSLVILVLVLGLLHVGNQVNALKGRVIYLESWQRELREDEVPRLEKRVKKLEVDR